MSRRLAPRESGKATFMNLEDRKATFLDLAGGTP